MPSNRLFLHVFSSIASLFILVLTPSCTTRSDYVNINGYAQGGTYGIKLNLIKNDGKRAKVSQERLRRDIDSILIRIDSCMSGYNKASQLSRLNSGERVKPDELLTEIYSISRRVWEETGGAVDVAAGPLFDAWGFGFKEGALPDKHLIDSISARCGMQLLPERLEDLADAEGYIRLPEGIVLNFNAIAQGFSCDVIARYLHSLGVKDMLIDIGEIFCEGVSPRGEGWKIGIDTPIDGNNTPGASMEGVWESDSNACGIVTSGNYRKFYIKDGRKYAHTIDPRSGYPVEHNLLSATITAPSATMADAYATYCMVIGLQKAKEFILSRPDLEACLIFDEQGAMGHWMSEGFKARTSVNEGR